MFKTSLEEVLYKLDKLGYCVDKSAPYELHGRFRQTGSLDEFKFVNQKHYDAFACLLMEYIQEQMQQPEYGSLQKVMIPENSDGPKCDIYMSESLRREFSG
jgi:hypothetical protein